MSQPTHPTATLGVIPDRASYLLIFDDGGSRRVALPNAGGQVIGRADDCDIQLSDASASRRHARLDAVDEGLFLVDLESRHGTRINGRRVQARAALVSGDVIQVGRSSLVVRIAPRGHGEADALDHAGIQQRLDRELLRARRHRRPLGIVLVHGLEDGAEHALREVRARLDAAGAVGLLDEETLLAVLPEAGPTESQAFARAFAATVRERVAASRVASASYPLDASDAGGLLTAARAHLVNDDGRITIGDRSVIVADPAMAKTYELLQKLAASDIAVLVVGETGAGKEMAAYAIHACSRRAAAPLIAVNCAALPETLIESELFGHEKGAFSGADRTKPGLIERAAGGTLFLDELLELPPPAQAKLLRALEERAVHRVGGLAPISVDFRLVAATNRDVATEVAAGRLREDLYYRVAGAVVELPPLRDRPRDITVLARAFLERACERANKPRRVFSDGALRALGSYRFPGNVRELANAIEFACATSGDDVVEAWHLPAAITQADAAVADAAASPRAFRPIDEEIAELERRRMTEALEATDGNQSRAADLIGMPRRTFVTKATRYGLRRTGSRR